MVFLPVVVREMTILARRKSTYWTRAVSAVIAAITMGWLFLVSSSQVSLGELGNSIFLIVSTFCFCFALLIGVQATSDCVSEEKREGTLGLLFLTDLRPLDIVLGKLAASSFNGVFAVLGVVPMMSLALLLGGVSVTRILLTTMVLFNSMFLSLSVGVLVSALSKNERKAMFASFVGLFLLSVLPFTVSFAISDFETTYKEIAFVSPIYSFMSAQVSPGSRLDTSYLALALGFQHACAWTCLAAATLVLPRAMSELPKQRFPKVRLLIENYVFGRREQRARYRAALLDRNPFLWLASRERIKARYAWALVLLFALLFLWVRQQFPNIFLDPPVPLFIIFLVHFTLKIWAASEVCSRLLADRRSGALELLLSSPLTVPQIARGQQLALRRIFRGPAAVLTVAELGVMTLVIREPRQDTAVLDSVVLYLAAITTLWLDLWTLRWVGMWLCLFGKSIERVLIATLARVLGIPTLLFAVGGASAAAFLAMYDNRLRTVYFYSGWWALSVLWAVGLGGSARQKFLSHCREAAAQTYNPHASAATFRPARTRPAPARRWLLISEHPLLSTAAGILLAAIVMASARNLYWTRKVRDEVAAIRAEGQPTSSSEVGKIYPTVPAREDGFVWLQTAGGVNWGRWIDSNYANQLLIQLKKSPKKVVDQVKTVLANNQAQLKAIQQIRAFDKAYLAPASADFWALPVDLSGYTALLIADLIESFSCRDQTRAAADLKLMLHLATLVRSLPLERMQRTCLEILEAVSSAAEGALSLDLIQSEDLVDLLQGIDRIRAEAPLAACLSLERARLLDGYEHLDQIGPGPTPLFISAAIGFLKVVGSYPNQVAAALVTYRSVQAQITGSPSRVIELPFLNQLQGGGNNLLNLWSKSTAQRIGTLVDFDSSICARTEVLRAAVGAQLYRARSKSYPDQLRQLVPDILENVPRDPFSGENLDYTRTSLSLRIALPGRLNSSSTVGVYAIELSPTNSLNTAFPHLK